MLPILLKKKKTKREKAIHRTAGKKGIQQVRRREYIIKLSKVNFADELKLNRVEWNQRITMKKRNLRIWDDIEKGESGQMKNKNKNQSLNPTKKKKKKANAVLFHFYSIFFL